MINQITSDINTDNLKGSQNFEKSAEHTTNRFDDDYINDNSIELLPIKK